MASLSQLPSSVDISFVAGDTFRIRVRVVTPGTGEPVPLDQYVFSAQIAKDPTREIVASFSVAPDPESPNEAVILTLAPDDTAVLPGMGTGSEFTGLWDLEVVFPNDDVRTVASGAVHCKIDVTNRGVVRP